MSSSSLPACHACQELLIMDYSYLTVNIVKISVRRKNNLMYKMFYSTSSWIKLREKKKSHKKLLKDSVTKIALCMSNILHLVFITVHGHNERQCSWQGWSVAKIHWDLYPKPILHSLFLYPTRLSKSLFPIKSHRTRYSHRHTLQTMISGLPFLTTEVATRRSLLGLWH